MLFFSVLGILVLQCFLLGIEGNCGLFDACGFAGAGNWSGDPVRVEREALARAPVQRGPLLYLPAAAHHI